MKEQSPALISRISLIADWPIFFSDADSALMPFDGIEIVSIPTSKDDGSVWWPGLQA
jgi:hypothetical protein